MKLRYLFAYMLVTAAMLVNTGGEPIHPKTRGIMDDFVLQPLLKYVNRENIVSRLENVEQGVGPTPSARVDTLGEMSQRTGSLAVDELKVINHDAGVADVTLNQYGLLFRNQEGDITFEDTNGGIDSLVIYSDNDNWLIFANQFGGKGISFLLDDASHVVKQIDFDGDGNINIPSGAQYLINGVDIFSDINTTIENVAVPHNGWIGAAATTWTRTGNHTFTMSGDTTATYRKGTKVRYKDGGAYEYGVIGNSVYVGGGTNTTTVTLITNSDYAMAAATITDNYYSYVESPEGFPDWFNWTVTFTGFSADPTSLVHRWRTSGRSIHIMWRHGANGTSNATGFTITLPIAAATISNAAWAGSHTYVDNGTAAANLGSAQVLSAGTTLSFFTATATGAWTNANGKRSANGFLTYEY